MLFRSLFELLTGAPPYLGASATHVLAAHLLSPVPRLPAQGPHGHIPPALADLVGRMMAKTAAERPGSMAEVEASLEAVLGGHELPPLASPLMFRPWMRGALTLAAIAVVVVAIAVVARGTQSPPAETPLRSAQATPEPRPAAPAPVATPIPQSPETSAPPIATAPPRSAPATPAPAPVPVDLHSTPSGARVTLHGRLLGHTPLSVRLPPGRTLLLVFEAQGHLSIAERVRPREGMVVTAHLPPAPVIPGLDDLKGSPY